MELGAKREQHRLASERAEVKAARKQVDQELQELQDAAVQHQAVFDEWRVRAGVQH